LNRRKPALVVIGKARFSMIGYTMRVGFHPN
jgi:hypothetical protein